MRRSTVSSSFLEPRNHFSQDMSDHRRITTFVDSPRPIEDYPAVRVIFAASATVILLMCMRDASLLVIAR
jgi:hypothetical protein